MSLSITANTLAPWLPCPPSNPAALQSAIAQAITWAEGPLGANRPLGPTRFYTESWSYTGVFRLAYTPVILEPAPVFKLRSIGAGLDSWNRPIGAGSLLTLSADDYELDARRGELRLLSALASSANQQGLSQPLGYGGRRDPLAPTPSAQLVAEYTAGFAGDAPELQAIYGAIALLAQHLSSPIASGVAEIQTQREGRVRYSNAAGAYSGLYGAGAGQVPEALLIPFQRFRPKSQGVL